MMKRKSHSWSDIYNESEFFVKTMEESQNFIQKIIDLYQTEVLIDVGCGTGETINIINLRNPSLKNIIGVDVEKTFIEECVEKYSNMSSKFQFVEGGGENLAHQLKQSLSDEILQNPKKLVVLSGNTIGNIQHEQRTRVLKEMSIIAGKEGLCLMINWNSDFFGNSLQHFYSQHDDVIGSFEKAKVNFTHCTLYQPDTKYSTKWFNKYECESLGYSSGWDVLHYGNFELASFAVGRQFNSPMNECYCNEENYFSDYSISDSNQRSRKYTSDFRLENPEPDYYDKNQCNIMQSLLGGTDFHIGYYEKMIPQAELTNRSEIITASSIKSKEIQWSLMRNNVSDEFFNQGLRIADFGSGYGSLACLCIKNGARFVSCVEISLKANHACHNLIEKENLNLQISNPIERNYQDTGELDESFHVVQSQDSQLHAGNNRELVIKEASRIMKPNGLMCFTDVMCFDNIEDPTILDPILKRIKTDNLGNIKNYKDWGEKYGLEFIEFNDFSEMLFYHYENVKLQLLEKGDSMRISQSTKANLQEGFENWLIYKDKQLLKWGYLLFRKTSSC